MIFDFSQLPPSDRYKLITGIVVPRPIAWVTSLNHDGSVNAAPYSFFNAMGSDPALLILSVGHHPDRPKDTASNIKRTGEFVVNMVPYHLAEQMSLSATDFPEGVSETRAIGLELANSSLIAVPRIVGSPAGFECKLHSLQEIGRNHLVLAEIVACFVADENIANLEKFYLKTDQMDLVGRMGGRGGYTRTNQGFEIPRLTYQEWLEKG